MHKELQVAQSKANLAFAIGLRRIATVVDCCYDDLAHRSDLTEPFRRIGTWAEHKARMTYFWWVALGGNPGSEEHLRMIDHERENGFNSDSMDAWMQLFAEVVHSNLERDLADAWIEQAEYLKAILVFPITPAESAESVGFTWNPACVSATADSAV